MNGKNWVPPHVRERRFRQRTRGCGVTLAFALIAGVIAFYLNYFGAGGQWLYALPLAVIVAGLAYVWGRGQ